MASEATYPKTLSIEITEPQAIKVTPEELGKYIDSGVRISDVRKKKAFDLSVELSKIILDAHAIEPGYIALYRFHSEDESSLQSLAQIKGQSPLTPNEKNLLLHAHATQNLKEVTIPSRTIYSPYISATSNLQEFISTSLKTATGGDRNIKQDVFERADYISVFKAPVAMCAAPSGHSASGGVSAPTSPKSKSATTDAAHGFAKE